MELNMKRTPSQRRSGFTLIELLIVITIIAIIAAIAIPNLLSSRMSANEASCIGSIRTVISAEAAYRSSNNQYGTLTQLQGSNLLDPALGGANNSASPKSGYYFDLELVAPGNTQFYIFGQPISMGGDRVFYSDETGVIWMGSSGDTEPSSDMSGTQPGGSTSDWSQIGN
jgi:prepilin-type N-terminal cleavage/methylation domain-containing protein